VNGLGDQFPMSFVQGKLGITVQSALLDGERYHQKTKDLTLSPELIYVKTCLCQPAGIS
jgi:hypothetical protein